MIFHGYWIFMANSETMSGDHFPTPQFSWHLLARCSRLAGGITCNSTCWMAKGFQKLYYAYIHVTHPQIIYCILYNLYHIYICVCVIITWDQWPFQDPRLEVPTIYKANVRGHPHKYIYSLTWYSTPILGSWNSHWWNVYIIQTHCVEHTHTHSSSRSQPPVWLIVAIEEIHRIDHVLSLSEWPSVSQWITSTLLFSHILEPQAWTGQQMTS